MTSNFFFLPFCVTHGWQRACRGCQKMYDELLMKFRIMFSLVALEPKHGKGFPPLTAHHLRLQGRSDDERLQLHCDAICCQIDIAST